jgi:hypothetical protein
LIIQPGQESQYTEVEMSEEMRAQVMDLCKRAYDKGLADASKLDQQRLQLAYNDGWREGYSRGFHIGMNAMTPIPIDAEANPV